jgi:ABC-2 type transport system permease protein
MRAYLSIVRLRFLLLLQYRVAALAGIGTQFFFGLVRVMILDAFFRSSSASQPMTFAQTVTYIWLGQAMLGMLPWNGDKEVQDLVRTGNVAYELCRPLDLYSLWFGRSLALRTAPTLIRAVPILLASGLLLRPAYRLLPPASTEHGVAWLLSTVGAILLSAAITNLFGIALLWTISGEGLVRMLPPVVTLLSGLVIPLSFFPDWLQPVLLFLPFAGVMDVPFRFYTGNFAPSLVFPWLLHQLGWTAALVISGRRLVSRGTRRVIVQGG